MRTFKLIGMALIAVMMCVNFAACSEDGGPEANENGIIINQKRLVQITWEDYSLDLTYDSKGRLASTKHDEEGWKFTTNYTWSDNSIIATRDDGLTRTYTLSNNQIKSAREVRDSYWTNETFSYNSSNQLIEIEEDTDYGRTYVSTCSWSNGRITSTYWGIEESGREFIYSGKTCKGYFPPLVGLFDTDSHSIIYAHPELAGIRFSQLPDNDGGTFNCTYTFDNDGYVKTITEGSSVTTFTWK